MVEGNKLVTSDTEKEMLLYDTFFTGKHLQNQAVDKVQNKLILEEYSKIVKQKDSNNQEDDGIGSSTEDTLNMEISEHEIKNGIEKQQVENKSTDSNNIHPLVLKHLSHSAIRSLRWMFNWSLDHNKWIWNTSCVTFIRKANKGTYSKPGSYRPLSISSYVGKLFERILDTRLRNFIQFKGEVDEDQEGFRQGKSTVRYLFRMLANLTEIKRQKMACIILFIDFEKAYDSVHLPTLIVKLEKYGITGKLLQLIQNFLFQRKIQLKINNFLGNIRNCLIFGLPQGSVIAPFLFILYIADMVDSIPSNLTKWLTCFKFADDGTLIIVHKNMYECYRLTQWLCNEIAKWCQRNWLVINCDKDKTEAIILNSGNETFNHTPPDLHIDGKKIKYVKSTKVLGLIVDADLNFCHHAEQRLKDCKKKWGFLTKSTNRNHGLNVSSLTILLKTTVLTKLFYAAPIWIDKQISLFRGFWNSIVMKLTGATLNPHRVLSEIALHLPPLEVQAEVITTKFLCKILTSEDALTSTLFQIEGSLTKEFHSHLCAIKRYIIWRDDTQQFRSIRNVDLCYIKNQKVLHYNKATITQYRQKIWMDYSRNQCEISESNTNDRVIQIIDHIKQEGTILDQSNSLFNHNTTKKEDSFVLDFVHGNSLIFGKCRKAVLQEEDVCYFCNRCGDSAEHQLFFCSVLQDDAHKYLTRAIKSSSMYLTNIIVPNTKQKLNQILFIKRVKNLIALHEKVTNDQQHQKSNIQKARSMI